MCFQKPKTLPPKLGNTELGKDWTGLSLPLDHSQEQSLETVYV